MKIVNEEIKKIFTHKHRRKLSINKKTNRKINNSNNNNIENDMWLIVMAKLERSEDYV